MWRGRSIGSGWGKGEGREINKEGEKTDIDVMGKIFFSLINYRHTGDPNRPEEVPQVNCEVRSLEDQTEGIKKYTQYVERALHSAH